MVVRTVLPLDPHPPGAAARDAEAPLDPAPVFRLRFTPRRGMQLFRMPEDEVRAAEEEGRWGGVLTQEYVRWRMSW
jgi:RAT1-interacting protein